ncbi:hypothetical protein ACP0HM_22250 [Escherichia coli]
MGPELPDIISSLVSLLCLTLFLKTLAASACIPFW